MDSLLLDKLLKGTSMADVTSCLRNKKSLLDVLIAAKLGTFCTQVSHMEPWAVVVLLQADEDSKTSFSDFSNAFMLCPRDLPCGAPF